MEIKVINIKYIFFTKNIILLKDRASINYEILNIKNHIYNIIFY